MKRPNWKAVVKKQRKILLDLSRKLDQERYVSKTLTRRMLVPPSGIRLYED